MNVDHHISVTDLAHELDPKMHPRDLLQFVWMLRRDYELRGAYRTITVSTLLWKRDADLIRSYDARGRELEAQRA